MANQTQPTISYCVSNHGGCDGSNVTEVCLTWNKAKSEAAYEVDLGIITFSVDPASYLGKNPNQITTSVSSTIDFPSPDAVQEMACWILQNIGPGPSFECPKALMPPPDHSSSKSVTPERGSQISEQFTVTDKTNSVSLSWMPSKNKVSYLIELGEVIIQSSNPPAKETIKASVRATVKMDNITVVQELASWILSTIPCYELFECAGVCPPPSETKQPS